MRPKGKEYSGFFIQLSQSDSAGCETLSDVIRMSFQIEGGGRLAPWAKKAEDEANNLFASFWVIVLSQLSLPAIFVQVSQIVSCACTGMRINRVQCTVTKCYKFPRLLAHFDLVANQTKKRCSSLIFFNGLVFTSSLFRIVRVFWANCVSLESQCQIFVDGGDQGVAEGADAVAGAIDITEADPAAAPTCTPTHSDTDPPDDAASSGETRRPAVQQSIFQLLFSSAFTRFRSFSGNQWIFTSIWHAHAHTFHAWLKFQRECSAPTYFLQAYCAYRLFCRSRSWISQDFSVSLCTHTTLQDFTRSTIDFMP